MSTDLLVLPPSFMQVGQAASNFGKVLLGLLVHWNGSVIWKKWTYLQWIKPALGRLHPMLMLMLPPTRTSDNPNKTVPDLFLSIGGERGSSWPPRGPWVITWKQIAYGIWRLSTLRKWTVPFINNIIIKSAHTSMYVL